MLRRIPIYFKHAFTDLRANGQRSIFALLCIAAGVAAIVSLQTLGAMIDSTLTGSLRESNRGDIRIFPTPAEGEDLDAEDFARDGVVEAVDTDAGYHFTAEGVTQLQAWFETQVDGDVRFSYQQSIAGTILGYSLDIPARDTEKTFITPYIVTADAYPLYGTITTEDSQPLADVLQQPADIVISRNLADDLGAELGDELRVSGSGERFTLRGIIPTDTESGLGNIQNSVFGYFFLGTSATAILDDIQPGAASVVFIGLDETVAVDDLSDQLLDEFPFLSTVTTRDLERQNSSLSSTVHYLVTIMGLVAILIGGVGIVNTMLVIVTRRMTEIAVLKTIGLPPEEITLMFMVEAALIGLIGIAWGVLLGWLMAFAMQGVAETFVGQSLTFKPALTPALNGLGVGTLVTTIMGFIPTLTAGQVRPSVVLRPGNDGEANTGWVSSFIALIVVLLALSIVGQGLIGDMLDVGEAPLIEETDPDYDLLPSFLRTVKPFNLLAGFMSLPVGLLAAVMIVLGGISSIPADRRSPNWWLHVLIIWPGLVWAMPILFFAFGHTFPVLMLVGFAFILVGSLYILFLLLIWSVGGGAIRDFPVLGNLPPVVRNALFVALPLWVILLILVFAVIKPPTLVLWIYVLVFLFIHIPAIIITLTLPGWALGQLIQRFGFLDVKIAMRAMVHTKGRGATTLVALVVGIFILSTLLMLVTTIERYFDVLLEDELGGNVLIFPAGDEGTLTDVRDVLATTDGVNAFAFVHTLEVRLVALDDAETGEILDQAALRERLAAAYEDSPDELDALYSLLDVNLSRVEARELTGILPNNKLVAGRHLDPAQDTEPAADGTWPVVLTTNDALKAGGVTEGDRLTFAISGDPTDTFTVEVVGLVEDDAGLLSDVGAEHYLPVGAAAGRDPAEILVIADVDDAAIRDLRRALNPIPAVFVLETRLFNQLITAVIDQFKSLPLLVAALTLVTGSFVIANSTALSMRERRREIAIMKAIGLQRERVIGMLLLENAIMGLIGGLIGVGMAALLLQLLLSSIFAGIGSAIPYDLTLLLMGGCILISVTAAIASVWNASGEKPLNVLRYE